MATIPLDPDYRTPWHDLATLDHAAYERVGWGDTLQIALDDTGIADRPADMTAAEARAALQQLVYTAQAAVGKRVPVAFTVGRKARRRTPDAARGRHLRARRQRTRAHDAVPRQHLLARRGREGRRADDGERREQRLRGQRAWSTSSGTGRSISSGRPSGGMGLHRLYPWTTTFDLSTIPARPVHPGREERQRLGSRTARRRHPDDRGQVAQREVRASSAATATTPAVEVRSTSSPSRTA